MKRLCLKSVSEVSGSVWQILGLCWRADPFSMVMLLVIQSLQGIVPLAVAWLAKSLFDVLVHGIRADAGPQFLSTLFILLATQALFSVFGQVLSPVNLYFNARQIRALTLLLCTQVYQKISSLNGLAPFEDPGFHTLLQVTANTAQMAPQQAISLLTSLIQGSMTLFCFLSVPLFVSPLLTGILVLAVLPQLFAQFLFSKQRYSLVIGTSPKERGASYYGQVLTSVMYAKEVRLFNLGAYFLRQWISTLREIHMATDRQQRRELIWQTLLSGFSSLTQTATYAYVAIGVFAGRFSLGELTLFSSAVASTQSALSLMMSALARMSESLLFFSQYRKLLALQEPLALCAPPRSVSELTLGITLCDVSFRYSDQHPWILRHVDLFIPVGKTLALVGLNGAGKTTLVKLLTRLYDPSEGQILWDGIDLREFDHVELRQQMGVIFQDFARYDLTAQENIGVGNVNEIENTALVQQAAVKAGIHERIEALPQGYRSVISRWLTREKEGVDLSGGEWQKLALARTFLRDVDLLILDEPTAALDARAEYELYRHFKALMNGKTCLLITHRLSSVRMADEVAVLDQGTIAEHGTHASLRAKPGLYAQWYEMQVERCQ